MARAHDPVGLEGVGPARDIRDAAGRRRFDRLLPAAAARLGRATILSEDASAGVASATIANPFERLPADILPAH